MLLMAVAVPLTVLSVLNLALTIGVIRRLREHTKMLTAGNNDTPIAVGQPPQDFAATTLDGRPVSRGELAGGTLLGFFSPTCQPCREQTPPFLERAAHMPGGRDRVLAVICGPGAEAAEYGTQFTDVASVVVEEPDGQLAAAFGVSGFPTFAIVNEAGIVSEAAYAISRITGPVPA